MQHSAELTLAENLKFDALESGVQLSAAARQYMVDANKSLRLTSADYASTSGIILVLDGDVWVNAPIADYNENFVADSPLIVDSDGASLVLRSAHGDVSAQFWISPAWHGRLDSTGFAYNDYGFTHTDRVRISPIEGCAYTCKFCDLPYEFRYRTKSADELVKTTEVALSDSLQPAAHILLSGGTPKTDDFGYLIESYERILAAFPTTAVDIMMVPLAEVVDASRLDGLGVDSLSINLELHDREIARKLMRRKHDLGLEYHLGFIEAAANTLGPERVRSMLMVGLESRESTLEGVRKIAERGCIPVLSPFRPDPMTPLKDMAAPTADFMRSIYLESMQIVSDFGVRLGPPCIPCSHNTLTLSEAGAGTANRYYGEPVLA